MVGIYYGVENFICEDYLKLRLKTLWGQKIYFLAQYFNEVPHTLIILVLTQIFIQSLSVFMNLESDLHPSMTDIKQYSKINMNLFFEDKRFILFGIME
jgi:hypothetical protein